MAEHRRQELAQRHHVALAIAEDRQALVIGPWPTAKNEFAHGVFLRASEAVQVEIGESSKETRAADRPNPVCEASELGEEIEDAGGLGPT